MYILLSYYMNYYIELYYYIELIIFYSYIELHHFIDVLMNERKYWLLRAL